MNDAQLASFGRSALYAAIAAVVMAGVQFALVLSGDGDLLWRPIAATFMTVYFGALATSIKSGAEPRAGSERLAAQVDMLKAQGYEKADLAVVPAFDAPSPVALSPLQVRQVADEIERRLRADADETAPHG